MPSPSPLFKPCPFCGSTDIDPEGWASKTEHGPQCQGCGATAESGEKWNQRMITVTYDELLAYLREEAAKGRVFRADSTDDNWSCCCPIASFVYDVFGTRAWFNGHALRVGGEQQQLDQLFVVFAERIDEAAAAPAEISAAVALQILEAVV